jgi:histone H3/H4
MAKLHLATFEKVLKESGSGIRVSLEASKEMVDSVTEISGEIARGAAELATHAGRKTILREDVKLAVKRFRKSS